MGNGKVDAATAHMTERERALYRIHAAYQKDGSTAIARLRVGARGRFVPHLGEVEDPILAVVGEAPGRTEHNTGRPFAGPSGTVLDGLFEKIGMPRSRCYITNAVHYRPVDSLGNNRTPFDDEITASRPYLLDEMRVVQPKLIVTLGNVPMRALLDRPGKIGACHGIVSMVHETRTDVPVMTMFHPAFGVYQKRNIPIMEEDWERMALWLAGEGVTW